MLVFDGECAFCNRAVQFVLAHERRTDLRFVPRGSAMGRALRERYGLVQVESILWIESGKALIEWEAVTQTAEYLGGWYARLAAAANLLPRTLLTWGYRLVAKLRKRLAGRTRHCLLLTPAQQQRFLS